MNELRTGGTDPRWRLTPTKYAVAGLLLVGIIVPLLVSTYDRAEPRLFGFPFFYWYQLAWVFLAAGLCALSFLLLKREREAYEHRRDQPSAGTDGGSR
ncbi:MAG: DUF3311 domain-containing protein [Friedmanniella sp.]|jgi:hypothetical protein